MFVRESGGTRCYRQLADNPRAASRRILRPRIAAVETRELAHDEQSNATARDRGVRVSVEAIKRAPDAFTLADRNTLALIVDPHLRATLHRRGADRDRLR